MRIDEYPLTGWSVKGPSATCSLKPFSIAAIHDGVMTLPIIMFSKTGSALMSSNGWWAAGSSGESVWV